MDDALSVTDKNGLVMRNSFQMSLHSMENWEGGGMEKNQQEPILCPTGLVYDEINKMVMGAV